MRPDARREQLLYEEIGNELLIYDLRRHRAHHLNRAAALVWQHSDGQKTVIELAKILQKELNPASNEVLIWHALERLGKAHLLREPLPRPAGAAHMTRRQALRGLGQTAALALLVPAVTTILAPTPVHADNCNSADCKKPCADHCKSHRDCPSTTPVCKLLSCMTRHCASCPQRRCVKFATSST
jgi:hypothetical protein